MKYLIIGKNGQLGKEFIKELEKNQLTFLALTHQDLELSDYNSVLKVIDSFKPDIVINCSAYNQVDLAEKELEKSYNSNTLGVYNLKLAQEKYNFFLVHYSTDYVFDGEKKGLYIEEDETNPLSQYAKTKLLGERMLNYQNNSKILVFRVSWVFGEGNQNFIYKLNQWAKANNILKISCDEFSSPTSTKTITNLTFKALEKGLNGLYHLNNNGFCSRHEYAKFIIKKINKDTIVYPVYAKDFNLPAKRPQFSAMSPNKISKELNIIIPDWEFEVEKYLNEYY